VSRWVLRIRPATLNRDGGRRADGINAARP